MLRNRKFKLLALEPRTARRARSTLARHDPSLAPANQAFVLLHFGGELTSLTRLSPCQSQLLSSFVLCLEGFPRGVSGVKEVKRGNSSPSSVSGLFSPFVRLP
jgi:hypothetical protein